MALSPKLPPFFSCNNHFLMTDEQAPRDSITLLVAVNPKVPTMTTETGGGYAKGQSKFLVTNELRVVPFSLINAFSELKNKERSVSQLETTEFAFTKAEVIRVTHSATSYLHANLLA